MGRSAGTRIVAIVGGLLLFGLVLRLLVGVLRPILPTTLMQVLSDGWAQLYGLVSPAMPAIAAVGILVAICWVVLAGRRQ